MFDGRGRRTAVLLLVPAAVAASLAGCSNSSSSHSGDAALSAKAAAVTFKVDTNGVSEVLVSSPDSVASTALAGKLPAACAHFKETVAGQTLTYTAIESTLPGTGQQARVLT